MVNIRSATEDDYSTIHDVHMDSIKGMSSDERDSPDTDEWIENRTANDLLKEMAAEYFVVAEKNRQIVGFAALHFPKATITSVFVGSSHKHSGVGRALLRELERVAGLAGLPAVRLQAAGSAIDFYKKAGFKSIKESQKPRWAEMKKKLS